MKRHLFKHARGACLILMVAGCEATINNGLPNGTDDSGGGGMPDFTGVVVDLGPPPPNGCGDFDPTCHGQGLGPPGKPFPLPSDPMPDPTIGGQGVSHDMDGYLELSNTHASFDFLWISSTDDWGRGSVSKINSQTVKEVARYFSVTCYSNPGGSQAQCDGTNGCCVRDDFPSFQAREAGQPITTRQAVQLNTNYPSRTAVDWNGDVWVANRAFGGQSSATKIANDPSDCRDRNGVPGIQTSSDVNGDGVIDTDCNDNGVPDDLKDVQNKACTNGKAQEFYSVDDECILFTVNTDNNNSVGRPLALGAGTVDFGPSDAWAGLYNDGKFFRIDGGTGLTKAVAQGPGGPYGATVDKNGILWIAVINDGKLGYFDTVNPQMTGVTRGASFGLNAYGISMDRDQNVWQGGWGAGHAFRYTPDRTNGFASLGSGFWTVVQNPGANSGTSGNGRGIAADSRNMNSFFVYMARDDGWIAQINASGIPLPQGADVQVDGRAMPAIRVAGSNTIGVGVDIMQNVWGISYTGSVATRIKVDAQGAMTPPDVNGGANNQGCPVGAGDRCTLGFKNQINTDPYTYSDFTGFGLRNFTTPKGSYSVIQPGCMAGDTRWMRIEWDAVVPMNTSLGVRARLGDTPTPDNSWGGWSATYTMSPADVSALMPANAKYMQVEFDFSTMDKNSTPKLKSFSVYYECSNIPG